jgi:DNA-binding CsgD family transcriptional regulator
MSVGEISFATAVEAIYRAALEPESWPDVLQFVASVFDDVGALLLWRRDDGTFGALVSPTLGQAHENYAAWQHLDIRATRGFEQRLSYPDVVTDRHLVSRQEIEEHPFYSEFLRPNGLGWVAATEVSPDRRVDVKISVQRSWMKAEFTDEELERLGRLAKHIELSLRLSIRMLDAELTKLGLGEALARIGAGVLALDAQKRVVFSNPAVEMLIGEGLVISKDRQLRSECNDSTFQTKIDKVLHAAPDSQDALRPFLVYSAKSERPLAAYFLPVLRRDWGVAEAFLTHTRVIVLVLDWRRTPTYDPSMLRDVLGLTLGEARLAALVGTGLPPKEAAQKLGIAEVTARGVLKSVFAKTGVSRQSELAALLTRILLRAQ